LNLYIKELFEHPVIMPSKTTDELIDRLSLFAIIVTPLCVDFIVINIFSSL